MGAPCSAAFTAPYYVGLSVMSSDWNAINTAKFDNVSFVDFATAAPLATTLTGTAANGAAAHLTWAEAPARKPTPSSVMASRLARATRAIRCLTTPA